MPLDATLAPVLLGLLGLLVGSFLNVVIHRLPKMMERQWARECAEMQAPDGADAPATPETRYNLMVPRSACPHCGHAIRWFENIPVLSYAALRGRCSACKAPISARYPGVELFTGLLFAWCGWQWGASVQALLWRDPQATTVSVPQAEARWDWQGHEATSPVEVQVQARGLSLQRAGLGDLKVGRWRNLTDQELRGLLPQQESW